MSIISEMIAAAGLNKLGSNVTTVRISTIKTKIERIL